MIPLGVKNGDYYKHMAYLSTSCGRILCFGENYGKIHAEVNCINKFIAKVGRGEISRSKCRRLTLTVLQIDGKKSCQEKNEFKFKMSRPCSHCTLSILSFSFISKITWSTQHNEWKTIKKHSL